MSNKDDFMRYATSRLDKKRAEIEKGRQAAINHLYENSYRIHQRLRHTRKVGHKEW